MYSSFSPLALLKLRGRVVGLFKKVIQMRSVKTTPPLKACPDRSVRGVGGCIKKASVVRRQEERCGEQAMIRELIKKVFNQ